MTENGSESSNEMLIFSKTFFDETVNEKHHNLEQFSDKFASVYNLTESEIPALEYYVYNVNIFDADSSFQRDTLSEISKLK